MLKVIVDTSFLMAVQPFKIDLIGELDRLIGKKYRLLVPIPVLNELYNILEKGNLKEKVAAKVALELVKGKKLERVESPADPAILKLAGKGNSAVATNDVLLRKEARKLGAPVIYLRGKSHLAISGEIF